MVNVLAVENKMFPLEVSNVGNFALVTGAKNDSGLLHLRYEHLNFKGRKLLSQKCMVFGLLKINTFDLCEGCINGKQSRKSFPVGKVWRVTTCLKLIHAYLCCPMSTESFGGSRYFPLITDDFSRMSWVYFLKYKSEVL